MPHRAGRSRLALIKHESGHFLDEAPAAPVAQADALERSRWQEEVIELMNDSMSPELVCVLRYRPQDRSEASDTTGGTAPPPRAWPVSASQQRADAIAERIADRIVDRIMQWEHVAMAGAAAVEGEPAAARRRDEPPRDPLHAADVTAVRRAMDSVGGRPLLTDQKNPAMRRMREDALAEGEAHADDWMAG